MPFDQPTRNALAAMVVECRRLLTFDIADQLQRVYGLQPDGSPPLPVETLHIDSGGKEVAHALRGWLAHVASGETGSEKERLAAAFERLRDETAFTALNRLAALRLCEERGHVIECVRRGVESDGFALYDRLANGALGERGEVYRAFLERLFDELAVDLGPLFNRELPQSLVFPSAVYVERVLAELNAPSLAPVWREDETIGWIYQYFNPKKERDKLRDASNAPRNSRELAVRNQFFTPRYVVEFLTDNTLGRLWYEMRHAKTDLATDCRALVRRPSEVFLLPGQAPSGDSSAESVEDWLGKPEYVPHRAVKDPREIRVLDPACGSGHFLLYAYDLLSTMYEEAWCDPVLGPALWEECQWSPPSSDSPHVAAGSDEALRRLRVWRPAAILRHNLYGIDIDPRACQIAALALWLRAQRDYQMLGLRAADRPAIRKTNIVCAEPMPGNREMLREFTERLRPRVLGQLVEKVFDEMKLAGEAGSLLKVDQKLRSAIAEAKRQWLAGSRPEQIALFPETKHSKAEQGTLFDLSGITDEEFWAGAEGRILEDLHRYAEEAVAGGARQRHLFEDDVVQGFAFIDLCRMRFDVVLMNPPFGKFSHGYKTQASVDFPSTDNDILAAFVERFLDMLLPQGLLGAITSRTAFFLSTFKRWRTDVVLECARLEILADLGEEVMDEAMVEAAAYCLGREPAPGATVFLRFLGHEDRPTVVGRAIASIRAGDADPTLFVATPEQFAVLPDAPFVYWVDAPILGRLARLPRFEPTVGQVRQGLSTSDDPRFVRAIWEVSATELYSRSLRETSDSAGRWAFHVKAGSSQPWFSPVTVVVNWASDGRELEQRIIDHGDSPSRYLRSRALYFSPGVSWTRRAVRFVPYAIPAGCIPTASRYMAFPKPGLEFATLGVTASNVASAFLRFYGEWFTRPNFLVENLKALPWPSLPEALQARLEGLAREQVAKRRRAYQNHEPFHEFTAPSPCFPNPEGDALAFDLGSILGAELDQSVAGAYGLSTLDAVIVGRDLREAIRARAASGQGENGGEEGDDRELVISETPRDQHEALISYALGCVFGRWDIRIGRDVSLAPRLPGPFDRLPTCPPGMLQGPDGLPAKSNFIASEQWLRARPDAAGLPGVDLCRPVSQQEYPLRVAWEGILVDDPGLDDGRPHADDIVGRVREALELLLGSRVDDVLHAACEMLEARDLRDYLRKPGRFFADHLRRYSKSSRQAPIYWPLSTTSGSYTVWIYTHRMTADTLYTAVNRYVEPKIASVERALADMRERLGGASGRQATALRDVFEATNEFLLEVNDLRQEVLRVAGIPYRPDLNDGILVTAAPLWKLFRLPKWSKDLKACWQRLEGEDHEWAHLAYAIWPDRVREKCKRNRSLAIAHGLEDICEVPARAARLPTRNGDDDDADVSGPRATPRRTGRAQRTAAAAARGARAARKPRP